MEIAKPEVAAVAAAVLKVEDIVKDLGELELVIVGGGVGEVILA